MESYVPGDVWLSLVWQTTMARYDFRSGHCSFFNLHIESDSFVFVTSDVALLIFMYYKALQMAVLKNDGEYRTHTSTSNSYNEIFGVFFIRDVVDKQERIQTRKYFDFDFCN